MAKGAAQFSLSRVTKSWLSDKTFIPHTAELLASPAWRARSIHARRLIDALETEHLHHAGAENGFLRLTWRQMRAAGIPNDRIADAIAELEALGLLTVTHRGSYRGGARNNPSLYQLNYLPSKFVPVSGPPINLPPLDTWREWRPNNSHRMLRRGGATRHLQGEH